NAGFIGPTARCVADGSASTDGTFSTSGTLTTPAAGYAPGSGYVDGFAEMETTLPLAAPRQSVEIVATVLIERASSSQVGRLGYLAPRVASSTSITVFVFDGGCECYVGGGQDITSTASDAEQQVVNRTVQVRVSLEDWFGSSVAGPVTVRVSASGRASTGFAAVGSASWELSGRVLSVSVV
ncbi:MAG TPA: hypothetical protein VM841_14815, partial [Actinomycetota bacterium]|nr:hypothetical protein [Actinomycetota bacterium]